MNREPLGEANHHEGHAMPTRSKQKERILARIDTLIEKGLEFRDLSRTAIEQDVYEPDPYAGAIAQETVSAKFAAWRTKTIVFLTSFLEASHPYIIAFESCEEDVPETGVELLVELKEDIEAGELMRVELRITGDVFDDLLEQSKYLLSEKYYMPAVVIAGAVLERAVKGLTSKHLLQVSSDKFAMHNQALWKHGVYDQSLWRRLDSNYDLRNDVAHGAVIPTKGQAEPMVDDVARFVANYFT